MQKEGSNDKSSNGNWEKKETAMTFVSRKPSLQRIKRLVRPLNPYGNQVSGHVSFLKLNEDAVCKPLNFSEDAFYRYVALHDSDLAKFLPLYYGLINVSFENVSELMARHKSQTDLLNSLDKTSTKRLDMCECEPASPGSSDDEAELQRMEGSEDSIPLVFLEQNVHIVDEDDYEAFVASPETFAKRQTKRHFELRQTGADMLSSSPTNGDNGFSDDDNLDRKGSRISPASSTSAIDILAEGKAGNSTFGSGSPVFRDVGIKFDELPAITERETVRSSHEQMQVAIFRDAFSPKLVQAQFNNLKIVLHALRDQRARQHSKSSGESVNLGTRPTPNILGLCQAVPISSPIINPWALQLYSKTIKIKQAGMNLSGKHTDRPPQKFMLLEDLTKNFKYPCILDLKMGTRQHGINATRAKMESQQRKCSRTTSARLGVRFCGMQVYQADTATLRYIDKYAGRQFDEENFSLSLYLFLHNGNRLLVELIPLIIERLQQLYKVVLERPSFRFYASSLLICYDGKVDYQTLSPGETPKNFRIQMIDFAHAVTNAAEVYRGNPQARYPPTSLGPDTGYLLGITSLIDNFTKVLKAEPALVKP